MKIKTKVYLLYTIFITLLILLGGVILLSSNNVSEALDKEETIINEIFPAISELNVLTYDYLIHKNERSIEQWNTRHDSISELFEHSNHLHTHSEGEKIILNDLLENHYSFEKIFSQLTEEEISEELEEILISQLLILSQEIYSDISELSEFVNEEVEESQKIANILITIFLIFIFIVVSIGAYFNINSITKPIKKLFDATKKLEKGDYTTRVNIKTKDEYETLGKSFNKTVISLGKIEEKYKELDDAKTRLLSITSHELKSPMTPIKAQLQMLNRGFYGKINKKQKKGMGIIINNVNNLENVITNFLDISRLEAHRFKFNLTKVNLTKPIQELVKEMKSFMPEKKITLVKKINQLPTITTDPKNVTLALKNILNNAIKFSEDNGKVKLEIKKEGKTILFSIIDQGMGIKPEDRKKIFHPFFQAEQSMYRKYGGPGIGLSISKNIIESLGGKIWFESKVNKGTTFYFTIPITAKKVKVKKRFFKNSEK